MLACFHALANPAASLAQRYRIVAERRSGHREVESLLRQMTLDEKIGQITQVVPDPSGQRPAAGGPHSSGRAGRCCGRSIPREFGRQETAVKESRLEIPLLFGSM